MTPSWSIFSCRQLVSFGLPLTNNNSPHSPPLSPRHHSGSGSDPTLHPRLLIAIGDNPDRLRNEAALADLCGIAPIPASSGKTNRHRLHRGGDRSGNRALHRVCRFLVVMIKSIRPVHGHQDSH